MRKVFSRMYTRETFSVPFAFPVRGQDELTSAFQREKRKDLVKNKIFSLWKAAITYPPGSNLQVLSA